MSSDDAKRREPSNPEQSPRNNRDADRDDVMEREDDVRETIDELQRRFALERLVAELEA